MGTIPGSSSPVNSFSRELVAEYLAQLGLLKPAERFRDCGEAGRGWVGRCLSGHEIYHAFGCEQRICPRCAGRRSKILQQKLSPVLLKLAEQSPHDVGLKHMVLGTNVNILDYLKFSGGRIDRRWIGGLRTLLLLLRRCVVDLMRMYVESGHVLGFAIGAEFGAKAGTLHFHILFLGKYVSQSEWSEKWASVNLGNGSYVWIEAVNTTASAVDRAVGYLCKYVTKPLYGGDREGGGADTLNVRRMSAFIDEKGLECVVAAVAYVFYGVRRFQTYGVFFRLDCEDVLEVCSVCGAPFVWQSEIEWAFSPLRELLNTYSTNNFCGSGVSPPVQLRLNWA